MSFESWVAMVSVAQGVVDLNQIAVDAKVLRRSHDRRKGLGALWLVSAWAVDRGVSLGQLATDEKSNEITAIPKLLDRLEIEDAVITIDAAGCQRNIAKQIIDAKGDYVLALKGNQEKWVGLKTIGVAMRRSQNAGKSSTEVRYFINSIAMGAERFARFVRGHWAIENTLHWCLDVTFGEDECRVRERTTANNLAWLKRFGLSMLKQQDDKHSIAMRRRVAGWNLGYLAQVPGIPSA